MTDQDKIAAILLAIQNDVNLLKLLRISVTNNITDIPSIQLDVIMNALGISNG